LPRRNRALFVFWMGNTSTNKRRATLFLSQMRLLIDSKYIKMEIDFRASRVGVFFWAMLIA
jgi:hypothetical protein